MPGRLTLRQDIAIKVNVEENIEERFEGFWADVANHRALHTSFTATRHAVQRWQLPSLATTASQAPLPRSCGAGRTDPPGPRPYCTPHRKPQPPLPQALVTFPPQTTNHKPSLPANHFCNMYSLLTRCCWKLCFVVDATLFVPCRPLNVQFYQSPQSGWQLLQIQCQLRPYYYPQCCIVCSMSCCVRAFSQIWRNWNHSIWDWFSEHWDLLARIVCLFEASIVCIDWFSFATCYKSAPGLRSW